MKNAVIKIDIRNLHQPLAPLTPRFAASYGVLLVNVPSDATDVFIRAFQADRDGYFDCPANQDGNGDWYCNIIGTCFPAVCETFYEVHAKDADGNQTALGRGKMVVSPFSIGGNAVSAGAVITVAKLPDANGNLHSVVAVNLGTTEKPDWTWQLSDAATSDTPQPQTVQTVPDATGALHQVQAVSNGVDLSQRTAIVDGTQA